MADKYAIYTRRTARHKWRLSTIMFNRKAAWEQAQLVANEYNVQTTVVASTSVGPVHLPDKLPASTPVIACEPTCRA